MNTKNIFTYFITCTLIGAALCAYQNGWLIIWLPSKNNTLSRNGAGKSTRKKINLTWWHDNRWHMEVTEIVWPTDTAGALEALVQKWLTLLDEEKAGTKKVTLQTAMLSSSGTTAYLSFDRNPFDKNASTFDKLAWFEGLCTSIKNNGLPCTQIQLLVQHKPLHDSHLDCSIPWPITGFLNRS